MNRYLLFFGLLFSSAVLFTYCGGDDSEVEICDNNADDDGDGFVDCADLDCTCVPSEICDNSIDDDEDGFTDCEDLDCSSDMNCQEICNNGIDDDLDGFTDCDDADCTGDPGC